MGKMEEVVTAAARQVIEQIKMSPEFDKIMGEKIDAAKIGKEIQFADMFPMWVWRGIATIFILGFVSMFLDGYKFGCAYEPRMQAVEKHGEDLNRLHVINEIQQYQLEQLWRENREENSRGDYGELR